jgi:hypothetical protein
MQNLSNVYSRVRPSVRTPITFLRRVVPLYSWGYWTQEIFSVARSGAASSQY